MTMAVRRRGGPRFGGAVPLSEVSEDGFYCKGAAASSTWHTCSRERLLGLGFLAFLGWDRAIGAIEFRLETCPSLGFSPLKIGPELVRQALLPCVLDRPPMRRSARLLKLSGHGLSSYTWIR